MRHVEVMDTPHGFLAVTRSKIFLQQDSHLQTVKRRKVSWDFSLNFTKHKYNRRSCMRACLIARLNRSCDGESSRDRREKNVEIYLVYRARRWSSENQPTTKPPPHDPMTRTNRRDDSQRETRASRWTSGASRCGGRWCVTRVTWIFTRQQLNCTLTRTKQKHNTVCCFCSCAQQESLCTYVRVYVCEICTYTRKANKSSRTSALHFSELARLPQPNWRARV